MYGKVHNITDTARGDILHMGNKETRFTFWKLFKYTIYTKAKKAFKHIQLNMETQVCAFTY